MESIIADIKRLSANHQSFESGIALYQTGRVKIDSCESFWKREIAVKGTVQEENSRTYKPILILLNGMIKRYNCSGKECEDKFCPHITALAYTYHILTQNNTGSYSVSTSPQMHKILQAYTKYGIERIFEEKQEGAAILTPYIQCKDGKMLVTFKLSLQGHSYSIKELNAFYQAMKKGEEVVYGKYLTFTHAKRFFHKESLAILEFVMRTIEQRVFYYQKAHPYAMETSLKVKDLELTKREIDELIHPFIGKTIYYGAERKLEMVQVIEKNPQFIVHINEAGAGGCEMKVTLLKDVVQGEKYIYASDGKTLYISDQEYAKDLASFYQEIKQKGRLTVAKRDMPLMCSQLLPVLEKYGTVKAEMDLEQYAPVPLEVEFSFDISKEQIVLCTQLFKYNNFSFNPIMGTSIPRDICRDFVEEYRVRHVVESYFHYFDAGTGHLLMKEENEILNLISDGLREFMEIGKVYVSDAFKEIKIAPSPQISLGISLQGDLLELEIDSGGLSHQELLELLKNYQQKKSYYRLKNGDFVKLENPFWHSLSELMDGLSISEKEFNKGTVLVPAYRAMYVDEVLSDAKGSYQKKNKGFKQLLRDLKHRMENDFDLPNGILTKLRPYQEIGYQWMKTLSLNGFGGVLADDMGLGKTLQVITLLTDEKEQLLEMPALVVCPASLLYNWEHEITRFSPELTILTISGDAFVRSERIQSIEKYHVWITSYDLLKRDILLYEEKQFSYQIIDEAQVIKNHSTQGAKAVKQIKARHRFALTGTPIENRLSELWSIFDFVMPGFLYGYQRFRENIESPIVKNQDEQVTLRLRRMLEPFLLRRVKKDVLKELPDKIEEVVFAKMEDKQQGLYVANVLALKGELEQETEASFQANRLRILAQLTKLRQICCDPNLCYDNYEGESAKLNTCMELLKEGVEGGHKIVLFSQFTTMLDRIRLRLDELGLKSYSITGKTNKKERVELAERFNTEPIEGGVLIFLISLKAGGTGLNLVGADMVIHYDPWWNLAVQNQASDRTHRIGQKNTVHVIKLIMKHTIEENIVRMQENKKQLADQIIGEGDMGFTSLNLTAFMELLSE